MKMKFTELEKAEKRNFLVRYNLGMPQLCELKTGMIAKINHTYGM